jgi:lysophospholipase L1-like esterase
MEPGSGAGARTGADFELFAKIVSLANKQTQSQGGQLVLVYLPEYRRYSSLTYPQGEAHTVRRIAEETEIPLVDIASVFARHPNPLSLYSLGLPGHCSNEGYRLIADALLEALERRGLKAVSKPHPGPKTTS